MLQSGHIQKENVGLSSTIYWKYMLALFDITFINVTFGLHIICNLALLSLFHYRWSSLMCVNNYMCCLHCGLLWQLIPRNHTELNCMLAAMLEWQNWIQIFQILNICVLPSIPFQMFPLVSILNSQLDSAVALHLRKRGYFTKLLLPRFLAFKCVTVRGGLYRGGVYIEEVCI